jgi:hypothetical protein
MTGAKVCHAVLSQDVSTIKGIIIVRLVERAVLSPVNRVAQRGGAILHTRLWSKRNARWHVRRSEA